MGGEMSVTMLPNSTKRCSPSIYKGNAAPVSRLRPAAASPFLLSNRWMSFSSHPRVPQLELNRQPAGRQRQIKMS